jgi:hypothetical protein
MIRQIVSLAAALVIATVGVPGYARASVSIVTSTGDALSASICMLGGIAVPVTLLVSLQSIPNPTTGIGQALTFVVGASGGAQTYVVPSGGSIGVVFVPLTDLGGGCFIQLRKTSSSVGSASVTVESAPLFSVPLPSP